MNVEPRPSKRVRLSEVCNVDADDLRRNEPKQLYEVLSLSSGDSLEDVCNNAL